MMPNDFMEKLCPYLNESHINYDRVRNLTKLFQGD